MQPDYFFKFSNVGSLFINIIIIIIITITDNFHSVLQYHLGVPTQDLKRQSVTAVEIQNENTGPLPKNSQREREMRQTRRMYRVVQLE